jgi:hypothetical protein
MSSKAAELLLALNSQVQHVNSPQPNQTPQPPEGKTATEKAPLTANNVSDPLNPLKVPPGGMPFNSQMGFE